MRTNSIHGPTTGRGPSKDIQSAKQAKGTIPNQQARATLTAGKRKYRILSVRCHSLLSSGKTPDDLKLDPDDCEEIAFEVNGSGSPFISPTPNAWRLLARFSRSYSPGLSGGVDWGLFMMRYS